MTGIGPTITTVTPEPTATPVVAPVVAPVAALATVPAVAPAPAAIPTPATTPDPQIEEPRFPDDDPDVLALKAAEEELAAEEKGEDPKTAEPSAADKDAIPAQAAAPGTTPDPEPGPDPESITIPKARFDEVLARSREAQIENIRKDAENKTLRDLIDRGVIQPHQVPGGTPAIQPEVKPLTTAERVTGLRGQQQGLAADFEGGKIGASDWEKQRQDIDDQILELRISESRGTDPAPGPQTEDLLLSERTDKIADDYPIVQHLTKEHLEPLAKIAVATMDFEGKAYNPQNPASVLDLRTRIAKMADQAYEMDGVASPSRNPPTATPTPAEPGATPTAQPAATPGQPAAAQPAAATDPVTAAQREAKLALAARQPVPITGVPGGGQGGGVDGMTEEEFVALTTEEIEALPAETLDRIAAQGIP